AASTRLATDLDAWRRLARFTAIAASILTLVHAAIAFTPLFDFVATRLIAAPPEVLEPARIGLAIMLPWSGAIAWRRMQQGVLIRCELSRFVATGTLIRLIANAVALGIGFAVARTRGTVDGVVVGASGIAAGVLCEVAFVDRVARRHALPRLAALPPAEESWSWRRFARFYVPLAFTPLISMLVQPVGAAAMGRMPDALRSLAAWPSVYGLVFLLRSLGFAFNEVAVALAGRPGGRAALQTFAWRLGTAVTLAVAILALTPLGRLWLGGVSGLQDDLAAFAHAALPFALLMPGYAVVQHLFQGLLVHHGRTRSITEAVAIYALIASTLLLVAVEAQALPGIRAALLAFTAAGLCQTAWLWRRARSALRHA